MFRKGQPRRLARLTTLCSFLAVVTAANVAAYPVTPEGEPLYADTQALVTPAAKDPGESLADASNLVPGDTSGRSFWPHETGVSVGTSETFADVQVDGSYYDPSLGRRVATSRPVQSFVALAAVAAAGFALIGHRRRWTH